MNPFEVGGRDAILVCVECGASAATDAEGWRGYLTTDEDEPAEVAIYCPECGEREFG